MNYIFKITVRGITFEGEHIIADNGNTYLNDRDAQLLARKICESICVDVSYWPAGIIKNLKTEKFIS